MKYLVEYAEEIFVYEVEANGAKEAEQKITGAWRGDNVVFKDSLGPRIVSCKEKDNKD